MFNTVEFKVYGDRAMFTDPVSKVGGEKFSYNVPTYQALKGIIESVYWKPTIVWHIDSVRVMNPIRNESVDVRLMIYGGGPDLSIYTYLSHVEYQVRAHFEWNMNRPDLADDRNDNKHFFQAKRWIEKGGRRDIFLGTRECQAYVEPVQFGQGEGYYDNLESMPMGLMFHGFDYGDETGGESLVARFFIPEMRKGVIDFPRPEQCTVRRKIKDYKVKKVGMGRGDDELARSTVPDVREMHRQRRICQGEPPAPADIPLCEQGAGRDNIGRGRELPARRCRGQGRTDHRNAVHGGIGRQNVRHVRISPG